MFNKNAKKIVILFICIILFMGGAAEAAKPGVQNNLGSGVMFSKIGVHPVFRQLFIRGEEDTNKIYEIQKRETDEGAIPYPDEDIELLARLVHAEANGESYNGKVAVAAAVLNRVKSSDYPGTIRGVIYEYNYGYQYCPVRNGQINRPADELSKRAVDEALRGKDPTRGALSFYNPAKSYNHWIRNRPYAVTIGNHVFVR